ncbi:GL25171 [Drosophila persimilis]|uniref:Large ribosomal subunit protein mL64 n=2 Tax=pseudoobscura subgroup TaxID=32358 RepID=A0A6I8W5H0_DROPS|nr:growth arrest and DNA damage-inducible proteins-interacting protein 1 [Drosophila persimilis]XP_033238588.1 growth arrest and DNA damage-inducible proteins-interacting protein 1 [Drosophila pseudoobscura]EDW40280.1 GL25171 [Drosophila persimilis]
MNLRKINVVQKLSAFPLRLQSTSTATAELPAAIINENVEDSSVHARRLNKSGLQEQHKNIVMGVPPYRDAQSWIHLTEKYQRKVYGLYGAKSNVNPKICFDSKAEQEVMQLDTFFKVLEKSRLEKAEKIQKTNDRDEDIAKKLDKLEQWKSDLNAKVAKREAEAAAAIARKERLVEEVRRHFGFKVDTRDERFKEMLEQKEKEDKKKQKEAKRKAKEEKMMAKLVEKTSS